MLEIEPGMKFTRWTVIDYAPKSKWGHTQYLCKCECGKEGIVVGSILRRGESLGCRSCSARNKKTTWELGY